MCFFRNVWYMGCQEYDKHQDGSRKIYVFQCLAAKKASADKICGGTIPFHYDEIRDGCPTDEHCKKAWDYKQAKIRAALNQSEVDRINKKYPETHERCGETRQVTKKFLDDNAILTVWMGNPGRSNCPTAFYYPQPGVDGWGDPATFPPGLPPGWPQGYAQGDTRGGDFSLYPSSLASNPSKAEAFPAVMSWLNNVQSDKVPMPVYGATGVSEGYIPMSITHPQPPRAGTPDRLDRNRSPSRPPSRPSSRGSLSGPSSLGSQQRGSSYAGSGKGKERAYHYGQGASGQ